MTSTAPASCNHLDQVDLSAQPSGDGCEDCLREGGHWVHLRMCRSCGHIGCCDSSPGKHATAHHVASDHALVSSYEPGEGWWWCFVDATVLSVSDAPVFSHP